MSEVILSGDPETHSQEIQYQQNSKRASGHNLPSISVIIPTWNSARSLDVLLASIERQDTTDFEVIVADCRSGDDTIEVAKRHGARICVCDGGREIARNSGAYVARSDFLLFVDSDMMLLPTVLSDTVRMLREWDALCYRELVPPGSYWASARGLEKESVYGTLTFESATAFRKHVFLSIGGYDTRCTGLEDMFLQAKLLDAKFRVGHVETAMYHLEQDVGILAYLRKKYGRSPESIAQAYPVVWRRLRSPVERTRVMLRFLRRNKDWNRLLLVPGWAITKTAEFVVRIMPS